jgi:succinate dehydrogenase hydrophobic anchor subunit
MTNAKPRTLSISQRGLNFETLMWYFTRLSALAMYALMLFALIGALVMGARSQMNLADVMRWAFMPNATHVQSTNVPDLAPWATTFWKVVAGLLLFVASSHGVHGLVVIADDYIPGKGARKVVRLLSLVMLASVTAIGLYVIWTS